MALVHVQAVDRPGARPRGGAARAVTLEVHVAVCEGGGSGDGAEEDRAEDGADGAGQCAETKPVKRGQALPFWARAVAASATTTMKRFVMNLMASRCGAHGQCEVRGMTDGGGWLRMATLA